MSAWESARHDLLPRRRKDPLTTIGPIIENAPIFPRRINVHFVQVHSPGEATMRTWERGSGITLACGTGASAVAVSGVLTGRTARTLLAHLPGGDLELEWASDEAPVFMTGRPRKSSKGPGELPRSRIRQNSALF